MPRGTKENASPQAQAVAEQIRREMGAQNISRRKLADMVGKSEKYIRERVSGAKALDLNDLDDIARVLGLDVIVLLEQAQATGKAPTTRNVVRLSDYRPSKEEHLEIGDADEAEVQQALVDRHAALHGEDPHPEQEAPDTP